jgi:hypothetical protein
MAYAGAAAAAAAKRRMDDEEEQMTQYNTTDLGEDWEFKIVRSATAAFRKPATLQALIDEEARAGWVMLEKFDDTRIRFKRRRSARLNDTGLPAGYDPYRTRFGMSDGVMAVIILAVIFVGFFFFVAIIALTRG